MKKSKALYIILLIIGVALIVSGILVNYFLDSSKYLGFGSGLGSAFIAIGIMNLILLKVQKPEVLKQQQINEKDERNIKIREKSAYATFYITMFGLTVVELIFVLLDYVIPGFIVMGLLFIHIISLLLYTAHYSKKI